MLAVVASQALKPVGFQLTAKVEASNQNPPIKRRTRTGKRTPQINAAAITPVKRAPLKFRSVATHNRATVPTQIQMEILSDVWMPPPTSPRR